MARSSVRQSTIDFRHQQGIAVKIVVVTKSVVRSAVIPKGQEPLVVVHVAVPNVIEKQRQRTNVSHVSAIFFIEIRVRRGFVTKRFVLRVGDQLAHVDEFHTLPSVFIGTAKGDNDIDCFWRRECVISADQFQKVRRSGAAIALQVASDHIDRQQFFCRSHRSPMAACRDREFHARRNNYPTHRDSLQTNRSKQPARAQGRPRTAQTHSSFFLPFFTAWLNRNDETGTPLLIKKCTIRTRKNRKQTTRNSARRGKKTQILGIYMRFIISCE